MYEARVAKVTSINATRPTHGEILRYSNGPLVWFYAGTASALMGSMQMAAGALGSGLVSNFHNGTTLPTAVLLLALALVSFALQMGYRGFEHSSES